MKRKYSFGLIALMVVLSAYKTIPVKNSPTTTVDIRVMTFNIRNGRANDGENRWDLRRGFVCDVIRDFAPDILGVQEACRFQLDEFNKSLPEYGEVGVGRDGGARGEYSSVLYLLKRFKLDKSGTFWLSDTPTEPSAHWGNRYRRVCTWVRLIEKESGRPFYVYNTHMDHQSQRARTKGAQLIMQTINKRAHQDPFVLMGDFNAGESNPAIDFLKGKGKLSRHSTMRVVDSWRVLHPEEKVVGTYNRFTGYLDGPKIDYIFVTQDTHVSEATIVRTSINGRYPSDHYPVTAKLSLPQSPSMTVRQKFNLK